jgi:hypothetical protein
MTCQEIAEMIASIGLPYAYDHFSEDTAKPPPFICFYYDGDDDFKADNTNYQKIRPLTIELYTDNKDFDLEALVETTINGNGLVYSRNETYINNEKMYMVTYQTEVVING